MYKLFFTLVYRKTFYRPSCLFPRMSHYLLLESHLGFGSFFIFHLWLPFSVECKFIALSIFACLHVVLEWLDLHREGQEQQSTLSIFLCISCWLQTLNICELFSETYATPRSSFLWIPSLFKCVNNCLACWFCLQEVFCLFSFVGLLFVF